MLISSIDSPNNTTRGINPDPIAPLLLTFSGFIQRFFALLHNSVDIVYDFVTANNTPSYLIPDTMDRETALTWNQSQCHCSAELPGLGVLDATEQWQPVSEQVSWVFFIVTMQQCESICQLSPRILCTRYWTWQGLEDWGRSPVIKFIKVIKFEIHKSMYLYFLFKSRSFTLGIRLNLLDFISILLDFSKS